jgi:hypothetical protein
MSQNSAIEGATRLGDIPFVQFTTDLVTGIFDSLVESHIVQMHEYAQFVHLVSQDLTTYINQTVDNVSFNDVSSFIQGYALPNPASLDLTAILAALKAPTADKPANTGTNEAPASSAMWWGGLINALAPVVSKLVDKISDPNLKTSLNAIETYNAAITETVKVATDKLPTYKQIHSSIAALIASNKYALLQNIVTQGMMQLKVTKGKISTSLSFNTWTYDASSQSSSKQVDDKQKTATNNFGGGGFWGLLTGKRSFDRDVSKVVTVSTENSYQSSSSGTNINIYGGLTLEFETK